MTDYFGVNAGIEARRAAKNSDEAQTRSLFEQECQRLTEVLLKRETRIKEIIESS